MRGAGVMVGWWTHLSVINHYSFKDVVLLSISDPHFTLTLARVTSIETSARQIFLMATGEY